MVKNSKELIRQYEKGSDNKIKRRYAFPPTLETRTTENVFFTDMFPTSMGVAKNATGTVSQTGRQAVWFSGAFRYHVPMGNTIRDRFERFSSEADLLLGIDLTPETVWNLAPWSWAADWFTNTGDIMTNISNMQSDGLVLQYGYVMASTEVSHAFTNCLFYENGEHRPSATKFSSEKLRVPATPFGFGFDLGSMTSRQKAILVAIGLGRTKL
jgi:hypothetical protein